MSKDIRIPKVELPPSGEEVIAHFVRARDTLHEIRRDASLEYDLAKSSLAQQLKEEIRKASQPHMHDPVAVLNRDIGPTATRFADALLVDIVRTYTRGVIWSAHAAQENDALHEMLTGYTIRPVGLSGQLFSRHRGFRDSRHEYIGEITSAPFMSADVTIGELFIGSPSDFRRVDIFNPETGEPAVALEIE